MSQNYNRKPYLRSYELARQIQNFFYKVNELANDYEYVVALESRCFNIAKRFLPQVKNLVTGSGLLVEHEKLAQYYNVHGCFPKILIIEDTLIYGRNMSKFFCKLEELLEADLVKIDRYFRNSLVQAVDIRAYARYDRALLIEDRYRAKLKTEMSLSFIQIHDLSMQLSDSLTRWGIANTIFSCSIQNKALEEYLSYEDGEVSGWKRILFDCEDEKMLIYIRFDSQTKINKVSTIRIYPGRSGKNASHLTSLTLTSNIGANVFNKICVELKELLSRRNSDFVALQKLLNDKSTTIQEIKAQLIYFLLSVVDLYDFCSFTKNKLSQVGLTDDVEKIACNFGSNEIQKELKEICTSNELLKQLKEMLYNILNSEDTSIKCGEFCFEADYGNTHNANDAVKEIFYAVGMNAEKEALNWYNHTYLYHPTHHQVYDNNSKNGDVISFNDFNEISNQEYKKALGNAYYRVASFVNAIDNGIVKLEFQFSQKHNCLYVLCVAGPIAILYFPQKMALAIPAFTILENYCRNIALTPEEAIKHFCEERSNEELLTIFNADEIAQWNQDYSDVISKLKSNLLKYMHIFYLAGHRFEVWRFDNLIYKGNDLWLKYQWLLEKWALKFLRFD